jgi:hypothetical protein
MNLQRNEKIMQNIVKYFSQFMVKIQAWLKFYQNKTWDIMSKYQISANYRFIENTFTLAILQIRNGYLNFFIVPKSADMLEVYVFGSKA